MSTNLDLLSENADEVLATEPPYFDAWVRRHAGGRLDELQGFYAKQNGFLAFGRALRVFPAVLPADLLSLNRWNAPWLWRHTYGALAKDLLFFADDIFGGQFCIKQSKVFSFDPETGELEWLADDLDGWAARVLAETDYVTGRPIALEWQENFGVLDAAQRLIPTLLFMFGGEYSIANLTAKDAVTGMLIRGPIAKKTQHLPDGAKLRFVIED